MEDHEETRLFYLAFAKSGSFVPLEFFFNSLKTLPLDFSFRRVVSLSNDAGNVI